MSQPVLKFSRQEFAERIARTRAAMTKRGLDLLLVSDPSNMAWLTGYDGWSFYVHQCVLLALDGEPVWFGRGQDGNGAKSVDFWAIGHFSVLGVVQPDDLICELRQAPSAGSCPKTKGNGARPRWLGLGAVGQARQTDSFTASMAT